MSHRPLLHVLGCGRAARSVVRCLVGAGRVESGLIVNRSLESAQHAVDFIGSGVAATGFDERLRDGWLMLGLPDGVLADENFSLAEWLAHPPALIFHLSGSVPASTLAVHDVPVASVHPVRAFADPEAAVRYFDGTWCVAEGDAAALDRLRPAFESAGGRWLPFTARDKPAWHASTVAASNFLVTIQQLARVLADRAGLPEEQAAEVLCDLQQGVLDTLRERSPQSSLTGPIERGDAGACSRLAQAAADLGPVQSRVFSELGLATLDLASRKRGTRNDDDVIRRLFSPTSD